MNVPNLFAGEVNERLLKTEFNIYGPYEGTLQVGATGPHSLKWLSEIKPILV